MEHSSQQRVQVANFEHVFVLAVAGIKAELAQVQGVARSAVSPLMNSFTGIEAILASQSQLLNTVARSLTETLGGDTQAPLRGSTVKLLNQFVDLVVCVGGNSMQIIERLMVLANHVETMSQTTVGIDHLARESRFVAFNARIQTIRAGEKGLTFKVIADEVKRLAARSAEISAHIRAEVLSSVQSVGFIRENAAMLASHDMNTAIESRARLIDVIARLDDVNTRLQSSVAEVGALVMTATRALRFEDEVSQIVGRTTATLDALTTLTLRAMHALATASAGEGSATLRQVSDGVAALAAPAAVGGDANLF